MGSRDLVKKIVPKNLFRQVEPYGHLAEAVLLQTKAGFPAKNLKVIGVTGTDGKTSTCTLITQMLRHNGYKVAMATTISVDYGDGKGEQPNSTRLTTMGAAGLVRLLEKVRASGAEWLVLETTSHALAQHRTWAVPYTISVMTNIGHEHLDYHGTFERYRDAKKMLFQQTNRNKKGLQVGIANADDPSGELFAKAIKHPVRYGVKKGDLKATKIKSTPAGSTYTAKIGDESYDITCHLPGSFNVYNSLAAVGVGRAVGMTKEQIEKGIASLQAVEGRMTHVDEGQAFGVIVDYAHTPESFEKLFKEVRPLTKGRLIAVFGSAGRRDIAKRVQQGEVAGRLSDIVIVTEEDDRDIDGQEILDQIASGAEKAGKKRDKDLFLIHDREDAVETAIQMAQKGDTILLLGKGHEKSILTNGPKAAELRHELQNDDDPLRVIKRAYDEVSVARAALKKRKK
jgi:UDP-N-acetylmuramoyl-L-alanyl-D-glutamate--2,6-diaminopimelate ligase